MTIQDEIERLESDIKRLRAQQRACPHEWDPTEYVPVGRHQRWVRRCTKCGLPQETEETVTFSEKQKDGASVIKEKPLFSKD